MKYLLDTNIIIYYTNGRNKNIEKHFRDILPASISVPAIVIGELEYGAQCSRDYSLSHKIYTDFLSHFRYISFTEKAAYHYGRIAADLRKKGTPIGANDMFIAAIALANNAVLVTHNTKEFSRIEGLRIEDWTLDDAVAQKK